MISTQVCKLDRNRREKFLEILKEQDSATFYLFSNSSALTKEGQRSTEGTGATDQAAADHALFGGVATVGQGVRKAALCPRTGCGRRDRESSHQPFQARHDESRRL